MGNIPLRYGTVTDLTDGVRSRPINSSSNEIKFFEIARDEFADQPANHIFLKNKSDKLLFVRFDGSDEQKYPLDSGDNMVFNPIDNFKFTDIEIINDSGANATGIVYITGGWLYADNN